MLAYLRRYTAQYLHYHTRLICQLSKFRFGAHRKRASRQAPHISKMSSPRPFKKRIHVFCRTLTRPKRRYPRLLITDPFGNLIANPRPPIISTPSPQARTTITLKEKDPPLEHVPLSHIVKPSTTTSFEAAKSISDKEHLMFPVRRGGHAGHTKRICASNGTITKFRHSHTSLARVNGLHESDCIRVNDKRTQFKGKSPLGTLDRGEHACLR